MLWLLVSQHIHNKASCVSFSRSEGRTSINIIEPAFESKIRAKVADVFPFMKDKDVSEHYKMIEQVLEDEKMVNQRFFVPYLEVPEPHSVFKILLV